MGGLSGVLIWGMLMALGILYRSARELRDRPDWIGHLPTTERPYLLTFREEPKKNRTGWVVRADVAAYLDMDIRHGVGGIYLYTGNDSVWRSMRPGVSAWIVLRLRPITNKPNTRFDFVTYCRRQKITHQASVHRVDQVIPLQIDRPSVGMILQETRILIREILYNRLRDSAHGGLATALLIGSKEGLDPERTQQYARTGTVHIIAISGLHISLVFEIAWRFLYPLLFVRGGRVLRAVITLGGIWIFCFLAGGEASVLRAGIMFTAVQLGKGLQRPVSGPQALGLSMLLLLIADPDWLFDPGFQLSHGAVGGILWIQPLLSKKLSPLNPLLRSVWESACMTLAATVGTLPFTLYYFHQFPWLFLPANLLAVPLSSGILLLLFALVVLSPFPMIDAPIASLTNLLLEAMNAWVEQLDRIPGTVGHWP